jgi:hypothetical protein
MNIPQYVHTDVLSNVLLAWMFHYTHHKFMDSTRYVNSMYTLMYFKATCVTECFITNYSDMDTPQHVHVGVP